jgi:uncharacterized membrane protein
MTNYIKFFHVLSVIIWVGGGVMMQTLMTRAKKIGPESVSSFSETAEWMHNRLFMPSSIAALVFGIWLVIAGGYDWGDLWITLGMVGFIASALIGMAILGPTSKKMNALAAERGPNDPVVTHMARRIERAGRFDLVILILVVLDMVVKPGL